MESMEANHMFLTNYTVIVYLDNETKKFTKDAVDEFGFCDIVQIAMATDDNFLAKISRASIAEDGRNNK